MSALILNKDAELNLTKSMASLTTYKFGLSWDKDSDLDAVAILLGADGKMAHPVQDSMAYYGNCTKNDFKNPENPVAGLIHSGDARDGSAAGDDETITIDTTKVKADRILICVTSYSNNAPVTFGAAANPVAKLYDDKGNALVEVKLNENAAFSTALEFVELTKVNGDWIIKNVTNPVGNSKNGLEDLLAKYSKK